MAGDSYDNGLIIITPPPPNTLSLVSCPESGRILVAECSFNWRVNVNNTWPWTVHCCAVATMQAAAAVVRVATT